MLIKNIKSVKSQPVDMEGASSVNVKIIFGPKDNAPTCALRVFELGPSGNTPFHKHPFEHEVVYLSGKIALVTETETVELKDGDMALIPPDRMHQFRNLSDSQQATFICIVPVACQK